MSFRDLFRRQRAAEPAWIDAAELQRRMDTGAPLLIVDVRQPMEFTAPPGHVPGAVNVPLPGLAQHIPDLAARQLPVVVVCKTDRRSARGAAELMAAGLRDVAVLRGGTDGWHRQGRPLEQPVVGGAMFLSALRGHGPRTVLRKVLADTDP